MFKYIIFLLSLIVCSNIFSMNNDLKEAIEDSRIEKTVESFKNIENNRFEIRQYIVLASEILEQRKFKYEYKNLLGVKHKQFKTGNMSKSVSILSGIASLSGLALAYKFSDERTPMCVMAMYILGPSAIYFAKRCKDAHKKEWEDRRMRTYKRAYLDAIEVQQYLIKMYEQAEN